MNISVFSPHGWVSSLAAESHNRTWQLPEETSPSTPSKDQAHGVWLCPLCCLWGKKNTDITQHLVDNHSHANLPNERDVLPPACSISLMQNLAVVTAAGWCAGASSVNRKSLPLRMEHTPCCAALRTWEEKCNVINVLTFSNSLNFLTQCNSDWKHVFSAVLALGLLCTEKLRRPW